MIILAKRGQNPVPAGTVAEHVSTAVQMVAPSVSPPEDVFPFVELTEADGPEMLALATLTKPGPYARRTHEFGGYIGIRHEGRLVAMAGHRLQAPGYNEVSALCTHPDYRGRGYGGFLLRVVSQRIVDRGETPFLHAYASNVNAIRLYETLGFVHRSNLTVTVLRHA
jgi:predicted GNAT family acetyltransferase